MKGIRERASEIGIGHEPLFRWRGGDVSRIEGLSDAVFGLAITLLVVSTAPANFGELSGLPAVALCFAIVVMVWHSHYVFFRRYGLESRIVIWLNSALVFIVLSYVYPLKLLFAGLLSPLFGEPRPFSWSDTPTMMVVYSSGFLAIGIVLVLMYWYAYSKREELELDAGETWDTRASIQHHLIYAGVAALSVGIAWLAGVIYFLLGPLCGLNGWLMGRKRPAPGS